MSNDRFPVTVIEDEKTAYYDVGLRLKASGFGRYHSGHYGFNVQFHPDDLFRGVHRTISIERSSNLREILAKHLWNRAGGAHASFYDDVAYIIPPTTGDRGPGLLAMSRHTARFFEGQFPDEAGGTLFNHELLYNPNGTTGGPEGLKINNPYNHNGGRYELRDRGNDKEPYRWGFQIRSERGRDDYSAMVALNQAMSRLSGAALKAAVDDLIDVNQWMRSFAIMSLNGTDDIYGRIWEHNFRYYVRPTDGKIMIYQWDLDRSFRLGSNASMTPGNNLARLFTIPEYRRIFDGHVLDLIETTFNSAYMAPWASHLTTLTGSGLTGLTGYVTNRANFALSTLPTQIPFAITTNSGVDFPENDSHTDLAGKGWINVASILFNGRETPVTWSGANSWQVTVPLAPGPNLITLTAIDYRGVVSGSDTITVTNTGAVELASAANTVISEINYHPADPTASEIDAGFLDSDEFEFVEIANTGTTFTELAGCAFTDSIEFTFPAGTLLAPGARLCVVSNLTAFQSRYGPGPIQIAGEYSGRLNNGGENLRLEAVDGSVIAEVNYSDDTPWPESADGEGYSMVLAGGDNTNPLNWRPSTAIGGNPGSSDSLPFTGGAANLIDYALAAGKAPEVSVSEGIATLQLTLNLAADDAMATVRFSTDLANWMPSTPTELSSRINNGDGTETLTFRSPAGALPRQFMSIQIKLR